MSVVSNCPIERFEALNALSCCRHGFSLRVPGVDVKCDREPALARLKRSFLLASAEVAGNDIPLVLGEQVHGHAIAVIERGSEIPTQALAGVDGLVTDRADICLGIMVADCCAVYLVDPKVGCIGLVHSGRKGTEEEIVPAALAVMKDKFGAIPATMTAMLSPCIRPPHYDIDFAAEIVAQCEAAGVGNIYDSAQCTGSDTARYYSYRMERGRTGRMLALLALRA